ncbi:hypothetical protein [Peptostreptococcus faecalis]|uniref:hypothetical protein n=1 Tax=Peptostreptococcus faecalis TaxID=2045015 RepID=UPI0011AF4704|nr:hypothetical protein [Peptostreptococcus faecalis]
MAEIKDEEYKMIEDWLKEYRKLEPAIKKYELDIEEIKNDIIGCSGICYEGEKLAPTYNISKPVENEVLDRDKKIKEVEVKKRRLIIHKEKMDIAINNFNSVQKRLFDYEFAQVEGDISMDIISYKMNISRSGLYKIRDDIIRSTFYSLNPDRTLKFIEKQFKYTE